LFVSLINFLFWRREKVEPEAKKKEASFLLKIMSPPSPIRRIGKEKVGKEGNNYMSIINFALIAISRGA